MAQKKDKKTEMIGFKTTPAIKEALESIAEQEDRSVSYIVNRILTEYLNLTVDSDRDHISYSIF